MAKRRMFSLDIIDTDLFLEMPQSSRLLYYELCMRADDDGFVSSPKKIQKMVGCNEDDFKVLISKKFLIPFDTGVVVIRHWKIHNYIQKDRYKETIYLDEKKQLNQEKNGTYTKCIQDGYTGKARLEQGEVSLGEVEDETENIEIAEITKCYEENIGLITPATAETLFDYLKNMSKDLIIQAIKIASLNNKRSAKYIQGILNDWDRKGIKTVLDVENEEQNFRSKAKKKESNFEQREYGDLSYLYANKGE